MWLSSSPVGYLSACLKCGEPLLIEDRADDRLVVCRECRGVPWWA